VLKTDEEKIEEAVRDQLRILLLGRHGAITKVARELGRIPAGHDRKLVAYYLQMVREEVRKVL